MERITKERTVKRRLFTRSYNQLMALIEDTEPVTEEIQVQWEILQERYVDISKLDSLIFQQMIDGDCNEDELAEEGESADDYKCKFLSCRTKVTRFLNPSVSCTPPQNVASGNIVEKKKYKLPKIEFKKFSGEISDWLYFWSQFRKIHEDEDIGKEDKFQYLIQAMIEGSRAYELITSFPPTADNYEKAILSLQARFGREDLQVEVYVRELLKLVLTNALNSNDSPALSSLYDKLESHLRSLESLGVTTDKCAAMLYPLIESSLPEELLRAWQRNTSFRCDSESKDRLQQLMAFLQNEVVSEERISLAMKGFSISSQQGYKSKGYKKPRDFSEPNIPTASALFSSDTSKKQECVFCLKSHTSSECIKAQRMTVTEKRKILSNKRCCFNCLKKGHESKVCKSIVRCIVCGGKHVVVMCYKLCHKENESVPKQNFDREKKSSEEGNNVDQTLANISCSPEVYLQTLAVVVMGKGKQRTVRAIIDTGSTKSYITRDLAEQMGFQSIRKETLIQSLFGGVRSKEAKHDCYKISLKKLEGSYSKELELLSQEIICEDVPYIRGGTWSDELRDLKIRLTDVHDRGPVQVLLGADVAGELFTGRKHQLKCGLVLVETLLGWTLMGKIVGSRPRNDTASLLVTSLFSRETRISELWDLEVLGITDPVEKESAVEKNERVRQNFLETVRLKEDSRYEVCLPWNEQHPPLPDNAEIARHRLEITTRKLQAEQHYQEYDKILQGWLEQGITEKVPEEELMNSGHYLPHRPVFKENSTTKIRPVFDASAKQRNAPSINDCIEKGPNLIELIPSSLLKFRENDIGVIADIEKAFLQISINRKDRDFLRFLWWDNEGTGKIDVFRHKRVVFGLACSPFLLSATINFHLDKLKGDAIDTDARLTSTIEKLQECFYVDNCATSVNNKTELDSFIREATTIMNRASFNLRGWEYSHDKTADALTHVLGLIWNKEDDTIELNLANLNDFKLNAITKRTILGAAHRVFDPIGFSCPVFLCPKLILQELWATKLNWDSEVDEPTRRRFMKWLAELPQLSEVKIPRCLIGDTSSVEDISLHVFCDASRTAYAAVIFLRVQRTDNVDLRFVQAKARVSPKKKITIPRLELLAATIGARLVSSVLPALTSKEITTYFWSDSSTVLSWIKLEEPWGTFVWNRVEEIRRLSKIEQWRHVPGTMNPADLASRGCNPKQFLEQRWWEGPEWLNRPPTQWPCPKVVRDDDEVFQERRRNVHSMTVLESKSNTQEWHLDYFSSFRKTVRMLGWIVRFLFNCRQKKGTRRNSELSTEETAGAEKIVLKLLQRECFVDEKDERFSSLCVFTDDEGLMRLKTKIISRQDDFSFRCPVILPAKHELVRSLIREKHRELCHAGTQILLSGLRQKYWILGGRRTVKSAIATCVVCKRYHGKHLETEQTHLPIDRVREASVFEISGVDFAGPLILRGGEKGWVCLFTCAVFRAVHLELVTSLATPTFLEAFRRFVSRRGRPAIVYSDNATNFQGTCNVLETIQWDKIVEYSSVNEIVWKFNPPTAPWWGGWWERLIGILKRMLRKVLGKSCLSYQEMMTVLCDIEAVMNSRPLTYLSSDGEDLMAITPAMFLQEVREIGMPDIDMIENVRFDKRFKYRQEIKEALRRRFRNEYLGQLVQKNLPKRSEHQPFVGEVVLVDSDNSKKLDWPLARVTEVIPGKGGVVRLVRLLTERGELLRPVQRVYPLEATTEENQAFRQQINRCHNQEEVEPSTSVFKPIKTSSGRVVVKPKRYED